MKCYARKCLPLAIMTASLGFVACNNDDDPHYQEINNPELQAVLQGMGYQFNENGQLIWDEKVMQTTSLDLSGKKLTNFAGLEALPNLTGLNLSANGYGPVFDLSSIPQQIKEINLTGNPIYDLKGLVQTTVSNDEVSTKILHGFTKLYLPKSAKWNVEDLMPFYTQSKTEGVQLDMKIEDENEKLQPYTTLREIPDAKFREYLKSIYASLFTNDTQIDISKPLKINEQGSPIIIDEEKAAAMQSAEGLEYFINNPYYPSFYVSVSMKTPYTAGYLMPRANVKGIRLSQINTPLGMDLSEAGKLAMMELHHNEAVTGLDLSHTAVMQEETFDASAPNALILTDCARLKEIRLPEAHKGLTSRIQLSNLPVLAQIDLSKVKGTGELALHQLPQCAIAYPENLQSGYKANEGKFVAFTEGGKAGLSVSKEVLAKEQTAAFIEKYTANLNDTWSAYSKYEAVSWSKPDAGAMKGVYKGAFTKVSMNGADKGQVPDKQSTVTSNNAETININVEPFKIGNMPFPISIDAKDITLRADGTFNQVCKDAVKTGIGMNFEAMLEGSFNGNALKYTLTLTKNPLGMNVEVVFEGKK